MTVREIRGHLEELYGVDVSPELISTVTDAVLDTIRVKIRDEGFVRNKAIYRASHAHSFMGSTIELVCSHFPSRQVKPLGLKMLHIALGILPDGTKEILGIWIEQTEGTKFWLRVMNELKNRGIADILIDVSFT